MENSTSLVLPSVKNQEFFCPTFCRGGKLLLFGDQLELFDVIKRYEDSTIKNYVLKFFFYFLTVIDAVLKAGKDDKLIL